jgi:thiol-disulfide isomerase/thioredoxin
MKRRKVLTGLGAAAGIGGVVWIANSQSQSSTGTGGPGLDETEGSGEDSETMEPKEIDLLDAPGSPGGTIDVPIEGEITVLDSFATWCASCEPQMDELNDAHDAVGDDATFVSISNEAIGGNVKRSDIADWWADHDGDWYVGLEKQGNVTRELRISAIPFIAVFDENRKLRWTHQGVTSSDKLIETVNELL